MSLEFDVLFQRVGSISAAFEPDNSILLSANEEAHSAEHKRHEYKRCKAR
jgi:hypothetical protein